MLIVDSVAHSQEHRLHSASVRCVVDVRKSLRDVGHTDESRLGHHLCQCLFEAVKP